MPLMQYPHVIGEVETIAKIKEGYSIARYGDGEFGAMKGNGYTREPPSQALAKELRRVITSPAKQTLIGIPTMDKRGDKYENWIRHTRYVDHLQPDTVYYSSLISRPDCGAWMRTLEYVQLLQSIWTGKKVCVIGSEGLTNKMLKAVQLTNPDAHNIDCKWHGAYSEIDRLEKDALKSGCEMILLSCGVTATCLANRLSPSVQAVDIGSVGGFILKMLKA